MGTTLSIVNDTQDVFHCKTWAWPVMYGYKLNKLFPVDWVKALMYIYVIIGNNQSQSTQQVLSNIGNDLSQRMVNEGFKKILPGQKHIVPSSFSLKHRAQCIRIRPFSAGRMFIIDYILMEPIFSGGTAGSNIDHSIKYWINNRKWTNIRNTITYPAELKNR